LRQQCQAKSSSAEAYEPFAWPVMPYTENPVEVSLYSLCGVIAPSTALETAHRETSLVVLFRVAGLEEVSRTKRNIAVGAADMSNCQ
jgi:hypothetical protein